MSESESPTKYAFAPAMDNGEDAPLSPTSPMHQDIDDQSQSTWGDSEPNSDLLSAASVWTDSSNPADRSSRRALILQMAKARMKSNKERDGAASEHDTIKEEKSGMEDSHDAGSGVLNTRSTVDDDNDSGVPEMFVPDPDDEMLMKVQGSTEEVSSTNLDFAGDLD